MIEVSGAVELGAYSRVDLRLAKDTRLDKADAMLEVQARNLGGHGNQKYATVSRFEPRLLMRASLHFN